MDREQSWQVIEQERRSLADLLETLTDEQWESLSLCTGWRVRDVAAHVALTPQPPQIGTMLAAGVRARGNYDWFINDLTVRAAQRPYAAIVAELREHAASRRLPKLTNYRNILFDTLVHGQDIAIPLGLDRPMPREAARAAATRVWEMGWPFHARRKLTGFRLRATDTDWEVSTGSGAHGCDVCGPIDALLLLLTGRTAALPHLTGPGAPQLTNQLTGS